MSLIIFTRSAINSVFLSGKIFSSRALCILLILNLLGERALWSLDFRISNSSEDIYLRPSSRRYRYSTYAIRNLVRVSQISVPI